MKSTAHLEQLFAFVDIRSLLQYLVFTWYAVFFKFVKETFVPNLIKGFRYVKKYTSSFIALIKRFINLMSNRSQLVNK